MKTKKNAGFTLIEVLVVVIILAVLASSAMLTMGKKPEQARKARAMADVNTMETALEAFKLDMQRYPEEEEGLAALVKRPDSDDAENWQGSYIKRVPKDPWGNKYVYMFPGYMNTESFDLVSYGKDGQEGGNDENEDIGNWDKEDGFE